MADQKAGAIVVDPQTLSTNFYYTLGKHDVFNCQLTLRGNPSAEQIAAHVNSAIAAMAQIVALGGKAKPVGTQPATVTEKPAPQIEFYTAKGKTYFKVPEGAAEPNEITCPVHGKTMRRRVNPEGSWWSHKDGDGWCGAAVGKG